MTRRSISSPARSAHTARAAGYCVPYPRWAWVGFFPPLGHMTPQRKSRRIACHAAPGSIAGSGGMRSAGNGTRTTAEAEAALGQTSAWPLAVIAPRTVTAAPATASILRAPRWCTSAAPAARPTPAAHRQRVALGTSAATARCPATMAAAVEMPTNAIRRGTAASPTARGVSVVTTVVAREAPAAPAPAAQPATRRQASALGHVMSARPVPLPRSRTPLRTPSGRPPSAFVPAPTTSRSRSAAR